MRRILKILGLVIVFVVSAFVLVVLKFMSSLEPSNDIDDYQNALAAVPTQLVEHFPRAISQVTRTRFYYRPGFMQGGTTIQLILGSNTSGIRAIRERYAAKAVSRWRGCPQQGNSVELMPHMQRPDAEASATCDYEMFILQATPPEEWNHGHESGIAFSEKREEILYWAKVW